MFSHTDALTKLQKIGIFLNIQNDDVDLPWLKENPSLISNNRHFCWWAITRGSVDVASSATCWRHAIPLSPQIRWSLKPLRRPKLSKGMVGSKDRQTDLRSSIWRRVALSNKHVCSAVTEEHRDDTRHHGKTTTRQVFWNFWCES